MSSYVYILKQTVQGQPWPRCSWNIGGAEVGNYPPPFATFSQVAGPFANRAAAEEWIDTEGRRVSGGVGWGEGGWDC